MKNRSLILSRTVWGFWLIVCATGYAVWRATAPQMNVLPQSPPIVAVPFDVSMRRDEFSPMLARGTNPQVYAFLEKLFEKNGPYTDPAIRGTIPKIIHQIWLGGPVPERFRAFMESWKKHHPDWEYRLWDDAALADFPMHNRKLFDESTNYGEQSDIARYEILRRFGGLYVDTDYEALQAIDAIHERYDFYIGVQPLDVHILHLGTGLIGCAPEHPLIVMAVELINKQETRQIISRTGPIFFSRIFLKHAEKYDAVCAFPASYFYPRAYSESIEERACWQKPESYAAHHWAGSWMLPQATREGHS